MRDLQGLEFSDFETKGNIILGKVEVDKDGSRNFTELEGVTRFDIQSNITNLFLKTCAKTFNIELLNTDDEYSLFDKGKSKYNHIKQGRRIKLYIGINTGITVEDTIYAEHETEVTVSDELGEITEYTSCGDPKYEEEWVYPVYSSHVGRCCMGYPNETSIRLTNIQIPQGAMIDNATLKIYMKRYFSCSGDNLGGNIIIKAEKIANSTRITSLEDYKTRVRTSAYTEENIAYPTVYTVIETDITAIIQEITDQENWESGNAINLFLTPSGDFTLGDFIRIYNYLPETEKSLSIQYKTSNTVETTEQQDFYWSWIYGIIDNVSTSKSADGEMCSISGRDYVAYLSENYLKNLWWGMNKKYTVTPNTEFYQMEDDCKGIYRAFLKIGDDSYKEIRLNSEFTYDWDINQFVFLKPNVPNAFGELWIYYFTAQKVEDVIADLLIEAGLLNITQKLTWLRNTNYCIPTGVEVDRVYFSSGTNYINAIEDLMQVAPYYRLYINNNGIPCFKPPPDLSQDVKTLKENEYMIRNVEDRIDELYNHFIIEGEKREMRRNWIAVTAYPEVEDLTFDSATLQGAVTSKAENTRVIQRGFIWQGDGAEEEWSETGNFELEYYSHKIIVDQNTNYKFKAFARDSKGNKKYSAYQYFKTPESEMS